MRQHIRKRWPARPWKSYISVAGYIALLGALTIGLGELFHKVQPWFSLAQIGFFLTLATVTYRSRDLRLAREWASMVPFAAIVLVVGSPVTYWLASLLVAGGLALVYPWVRAEVFPAYGEWWEVVRGRHPDLFESLDTPDEDDEDDGSGAGLVVGGAAAGLLYVAVFLPLTLWTATSNGVDAVDVLLFVDFQGVSITGTFLDELKAIVSLDNNQFLMSFAVLFGVANITRTLMALYIDLNGLARLAIMSNGLLIGYIATIIISALIGDTSTGTLLRSSSLSLSYVFLIYYASLVAIEASSSLWGFTEKYAHLISGFQSIATVWILSRVFGEQSILFSGLMFFGFVFIARMSIESFARKAFGPIGQLIEPQLGTERALTIDQLRHPPQDFWPEARLAFVLGILFPPLVLGLVNFLVRVL